MLTAKENETKLLRSDSTPSNTLIGKQAQSVSKKRKAGPDEDGAASHEAPSKIRKRNRQEGRSRRPVTQAQRSHHNASEKRRARRITELIDELKMILVQANGISKKKDKGSILFDAVQYIRYLSAKVKQLTDEKYDMYMHLRQQAALLHHYRFSQTSRAQYALLRREPPPGKMVHFLRFVYTLFRGVHRFLILSFAILFPQNTPARDALISNLPPQPQSQPQLPTQQVPNQIPKHSGGTLLPASQEFDPSLLLTLNAPQNTIMPFSNMFQQSPTPMPDVQSHQL